MKHLITGGNGDTGSILYRLFKNENIDISHLREDEPLHADRILHLAAKSPPADMERIIESNINHLNEIVKYAVKRNIREMVFFSAVSVYGDQDKEDVSEEDSIINPGLYGASKLLGEEMLRNSPLNVLVLRLPAILGCRNTTNFLSRCYEQLKTNKAVEVTNPDRLFNNFISVEAIFAFIKNYTFRKKFEVVNLASGKEMSVIEIITAMKEGMGSESEVRIQHGSHSFFNVSTRKAQQEYNFSPPCPGESIRTWIIQREHYERTAFSETAA